MKKIGTAWYNPAEVREIGVFVGRGAQAGLNGTYICWKGVDNSAQSVVTGMTPDQVHAVLFPPRNMS